MPPGSAGGRREGVVLAGRPARTGARAVVPASPSPHFQENTAVTTAHALAAGATAQAPPACDPRERGATVWLTGLPSSGKTTLAFALAERLCAEGHEVEVLDGDEIRAFLSGGLGFTKKDRHTNVT